MLTHTHTPLTLPFDSYVIKTFISKHPIPVKQSAVKTASQSEATLATSGRGPSGQRNDAIGPLPNWHVAPATETSGEAAAFCLPCGSRGWRGWVLVKLQIWSFSVIDFLSGCKSAQMSFTTHAKHRHRNGRRHFGCLTKDCFSCSSFGL